MKDRFTFILVFPFSFFWVCTAFCGAADEPIIVDHTAVRQFDQIPDYWLVKAKELTLYYGSTSHGMQILSGLGNIENYIEPPKYSIAFLAYQNSPVLPPEENPPALRICHKGAHPEDYWNSEAGIATTRTFAESGLYNFSTWSWCGEHQGSEPEYIQRYLDTMDMFEQDYPNMRFIYMTGHATGIHQNNNDMIRDYVIANNKILFDFEDIETHDPDGNYYPETTDSCEWCTNWCDNHPEDCVNLPERCEAGLPTCCPHSHGLNCVNKAKAFWWMMARLAGWDGRVPKISGDINNDCKIDLSDLGIMSSQWLNDNCADANWCEGADLNRNGTTDFTDFAILGAGWLDDSAMEGDISGDCKVDLLDFAIFANAWFTESGSPNWNYFCDIAPSGGDGVVNFKDLAVLCDRWLVGVEP